MFANATHLPLYHLPQPECRNIFIKTTCERCKSYSILMNVYLIQFMCYDCYEYDILINVVEEANSKNAICKHIIFTNNNINNYWQGNIFRTFVKTSYENIIRPLFVPKFNKRIPRPSSKLIDCKSNGSQFEYRILGEK